MKKFMPVIFVIFMLGMGMAPLRAEYRALGELAEMAAKEGGETGEHALVRFEGETEQAFEQRAAAAERAKPTPPITIKRSASQPKLQVTKGQPLTRSLSESDLSSAARKGTIVKSEGAQMTEEQMAQAAQKAYAAKQAEHEAEMAAFVERANAPMGQPSVAFQPEEMNAWEGRVEEPILPEFGAPEPAVLGASAAPEELAKVVPDASPSDIKNAQVVVQDPARLENEVNGINDNIEVAQAEAAKPNASQGAKARFKRLMTRRNLLIALGAATVVAGGITLAVVLTRKKSSGGGQAVPQQAAIPATPVDTGVTMATPVTMEIPEETGPQGGAVITPETPEMPETTPVERTGMKHKGMRRKLEDRERFTKSGIKPHAEHMKETGVRTREGMSEEEDRRLGVTPSKPAATKHTPKHMKQTGPVRKGYGTKYSAEHMKETGAKTREGMSSMASE